MFNTNNFFYVSWTVDEDVSVRTVFFLRDGDVLVADTTIITIVCSSPQWLTTADDILCSSI